MPQQNTSSIVKLKIVKSSHLLNSIGGTQVQLQPLADYRFLRGLVNVDSEVNYLQLEKWYEVSSSSVKVQLQCITIDTLMYLSRKKPN